jgi:hypothetical protein
VDRHAIKSSVSHVLSWDGLNDNKPALINISSSSKLTVVHVSWSILLKICRNIKSGPIHIKSSTATWYLAQHKITLRPNGERIFENITALVAMRLTSGDSLDKHLCANKTERLVNSSDNGRRPDSTWRRELWALNGRPQMRRSPLLHWLHTCSMQGCSRFHRVLPYKLLQYVVNNLIFTWQSSLPKKPKKLLIWPTNAFRHRKISCLSSRSLAMMWPKCGHWSTSIQKT